MKGPYQAVDSIFEPDFSSLVALIPFLQHHTRSATLLGYMGLHVRLSKISLKLLRNYSWVRCWLRWVRSVMAQTKTLTWFQIGFQTEICRLCRPGSFNPQVSAIGTHSNFHPSCLPLPTVPLSLACLHSVYFRISLGIVSISYLPLNTCWRCGTSHCTLVKLQIPWEQATEGYLPIRSALLCGFYLLAKITTNHELRDIWSHLRPPRPVRNNFVRHYKVPVSDIIIRLWRTLVIPR